MVRSDFVTEFVDYEVFYRLFKWRQGEHVTFLGQTRSGKTTLALDVLRKREYILVAATKRRDEQLDRLKKKGYREVRGWDRINSELYSKYLFRPALHNLSGGEQQAEFQRMLNGIFHEGYWTLFADEVRYLTDNLRLRRDMEVLWLQGRSLKISIVVATQRPAHIPLEAYSQASHLFFWRTTDDRDLRRISEIAGGIDKRVIQAEVRRLPRHQFLYVNTVEDIVVRSRMPLELVNS